jgi:hypothetical protein
MCRLQGGGYVFRGWFWQWAECTLKPHCRSFSNLGACFDTSGANTQLGGGMHFPAAQLVFYPRA